MTTGERSFSGLDHITCAVSAEQAVVSHRARIEKWCATISQRGLSFTASDLDIFIPPYLLSVVPDFRNVAALEYKKEVGRRDDEYLPDLGLMIVSKNSMDAFDVQEKGNELWEQSMNFHRRIALANGFITLEDRILIIFMAHTSWTEGAEVISYIDSEAIRGKGVGKTFQENLGTIFSAIGIKFTYGTNTERNIDFFVKTGGYRFDQLRNEKCVDGKVIPPRYIRYGYNGTVRFYDRQLEEEYVSPQFLRPLFEEQA